MQKSECVKESCPWSQFLMISANICTQQTGLEPFIMGCLVVFSRFSRKYLAAILPSWAELPSKNGQIAR